jgi:hypothetical protein
MGMPLLCFAENKVEPRIFLGISLAKEERVET